MKKLYIIPDPEHMEVSAAFAAEIHAGFEYNDFFAPAMLDDRKRQMERINAYARVKSDFSGDTMHGAFLDVTPHSSDERIRQVAQLRMRQSMDIAREMGLRGVVFHTNRIYGFREENYLLNWKKANEELLRRLMDEYPDQEIWVENMFDEAEDIIGELAESLADCPRFGVCLDYAHAIVFGGEPKAWLSRLHPFIRHMHINDNDLKNDLHLAVGQGEVDWQQYKSLIRQYGVNASVLAEVSGEEKQRKSIEYMKEYQIYPY